MKPFRTATITAIPTALTALAVPAMPQNKRIPVSIMYSGTDDAGKSFNYALKEQLTRSDVFQYSTNDEGLALI